MKLIKTTKDTETEKTKWLWKAAVSNDLESYEKIFSNLKKDLQWKVEINLYDKGAKEEYTDGDGNVLKKLTTDRFIYELNCNTREHKRILERRVGKKLHWIKRK